MLLMTRAAAPSRKTFLSRPSGKRFHETGLNRLCSPESSKGGGTCNAFSAFAASVKLIGCQAFPAAPAC